MNLSFKPRTSYFLKTGSYLPLLHIGESTDKLSRSSALSSKRLAFSFGKKPIFSTVVSAWMCVSGCAPASRRLRQQWTLAGASSRGPCPLAGPTDRLGRFSIKKRTSYFGKQWYPDYHQPIPLLTAMPSASFQAYRHLGNAWKTKLKPIKRTKRRPPSRPKRSRPSRSKSVVVLYAMGSSI